MTWRGWLGLGLALVAAACAPDAGIPAPAVPAPGTPALCRVGPDGAPPQIAERDRGIGGTGIRMATGPADRGIGGTGIVGSITGFASVCINGREVDYPDDVPVAIDGRPATTGDLRSGQIARVDAVDAGGGLTARSIAIAHEVVGPVERRDGGRLVVLGQDIEIATTALGLRDPVPGSWVAVSGFRQPGGDRILATRLDAVRPGTALLAGTARRDADGIVRIGGQALSGLDLAGPVRVSGRLAGGRLDVEQAQPISANPFGRDMRHLSLEDLVVQRDGRLQLGSGLSLAAPTEAVSGLVGIVTAVIDASIDASGNIVADRVRVLPAPGTAGGHGHGPGQGQGQQGPGQAPQGPGQAPGNQQGQDRGGQTGSGQGPGGGPGSGPGGGPGGPGGGGPGGGGPGGGGGGAGGGGRG